MGKITSFLITHRRLTIIVFILVLGASLLLLPFVSINYDLAKYLPDGYLSKEGLELMEEDFPYNGSSQLMVEDVSISEALAIKERIENIDYVASVLWLDDLIDINIPLEYQDQDIVRGYYRDGAALFSISLDEDDYSLNSGAALLEIRELLEDDYRISIYGGAEESRVMRGAVSGELSHIMLVVVPLCLLVLLIIAHSWFEPLLYILVIAIAIAINMGTNVIFDGVSFITFSMGAVIQLAISIDYSIFLSHRYEEERNSGLDTHPAMIAAVRKSFPSIASSALTTIAGFVALGIMNYGIGRDIGFVLAKGIVFSFLCVMLLMPVLLISCNKVIEKTRHRSFISFHEGLGRFIVRFRVVFLLLAVIIVLPAYVGQLNVDFLYGDTSGSSSSGDTAEEKQRIEEIFGINSQVVLLIPGGDIAAEKDLADELSNVSYVDAVQSVTTLADVSIPREFLPQAVKDNFIGNNFVRMILNINAVEENEDLFAAVEKIYTTAEKYYGEDNCYLVGKASSIVDIKDSVQEDLRETMAVSMLAVILIITVTFRSLILPVVLVVVIQSAIYINMSVPYFLDEPLVFIGYLIISSLQLGATIDYAILVANRYLESRRSMLPTEAAMFAVTRSGGSVLTSGLILAIAGFSEALLSQLPAISSIGMLMGRGALLSAVMVLVVLPGLLVLFDKLIGLTSFRAGFLKKGHRRQD